MHNKCNVLESSPNHPPFPSWKNCLPRNRFLVPKRLGTNALKGEGSFKNEFAVLLIPDLKKCRSVLETCHIFLEHQ